MTAPIPVYPGSNINGGRRTQGGYCWLTPNPEVRDIIAYLAIYYAKKHKIALLVLIIMSNHIHWDADDPEGNYPDFIRDFHARVTEVLNHHYGHTGPIWENCKPYRARLLDDETIMEKLLYAATNAVWHGLTPCSRQWPGLIFSPEDAGEEISVTCPEYLLDNYNCFDEKIDYVVPIPSIYGDTPAKKVRTDFRRRRRRREESLRRERGDSFLGLEKALAVGPDYAPPERDDPRDLSNKVFDCKPENVEAGLDDLSSFRRDYGQTRRAFTKGNRHVRWPHGTYAMVRWHKCRCKEPLA